MTEEYLKELPVAVTVTDIDGKIIYMNDKSEAIFEKYGGKELINKNINNYHNENSRTIIANMLENNTTNAYTIEKDGIKKMIFQSPWMVNGKINGLVEFSFEIPFEMSHFIRS